MTSKDQVEKAVEILKKNGIVSIPTETVYGLAGRISSDVALRSIFQIKNRPFFDPLIIHVSSIDGAKNLTVNWTPSAQLLSEKFWPGPLTLVLPKSKKVSDLITSGLETVAIRMPNHPLTLQLIEQLGEPVAAPSANKFGKTSPSEASHVVNEFGSELFVIDGGPCGVGIESTIIKIEENNETITIQFLRYGSIIEKELINVLETLNKKLIFLHSNDKIEAPGQIKHHYMPSIPLLIINRNTFNPETINIVDINKKLNSVFQFPNFLELSPRPEQAARELYGRLRKASEKPYDVIIFVKEDYHSSGQSYWNAILDRLQRAATYVI